MGASFWDQVGLPLLIGLAIQIVVTALCFLSVRLWKCLMKHVKPQTAVEESAYDQPLSDDDAVAHANAVPDMEMGNGYGPVEGGQSTAELELDMGIVNGGEEIEHFSDQHTHTPVIKFAVTSSSGGNQYGILPPQPPKPNSLEMPQEERLCCLSKWTFLIPSKRKRLLNEAAVEKGY